MKRTLAVKKLNKSSKKKAPKTSGVVDHAVQTKNFRSESPDSLPDRKIPSELNSTSSPVIARREFTRVLAQGIIGAGLLGTTTATTSMAATTPPPKKRHLLHVGGDYHCILADNSLGWDKRQQLWTSKQNFEYHQRAGVRHLTNIMSGDWNLEEMKRWKNDCDKGGMVWEAIRMDANYIYLPPGAARDRKLSEIIANIKKASEVGVKVITMHWTLIPIRRNGKSPGRGGSAYDSFKLEENWRDLPVAAHGPVSYNDYWERITYFLKGVIPVCEQYDVRMAVHPYDPPGLPRGYQGVDNWNAAPATVLESLQRYESIVDSPYNGFQLCLGTCMEGLKNPKTELLPIVKYFAEKEKIHQVHMRNIRGGLNNFQEVYPDEGEANFIEVIRILRDSGYAWSVCPDHVPSHPDDPQHYQGFAHAFGYIQGLIAAANSEVT